MGSDFGSCLFLVSLVNYNIPIYADTLARSVVSGVLTMAILWKGSPSLGLDELPPGELTAAILGTGG